MEHFKAEQAARALGSGPVRESVDSGPSLVNAVMLHGDLLTQVHHILSDFETRLSPVLTEPEPSPNKVSEIRVEYARSPLMERVADQTRSLAEFQDRLVSLFHRVQL